MSNHQNRSIVSQIKIILPLYFPNIIVLFYLCIASSRAHGARLFFQVEHVTVDDNNIRIIGTRPTTSYRMLRELKLVNACDKNSKTPFFYAKHL